MIPLICGGGKPLRLGSFMAALLRWNAELTPECRRTAIEFGHFSRHLIGALIVRVGKKFQARFSYHVQGSNP